MQPITRAVQEAVLASGLRDARRPRRRNPRPGAQHDFKIIKITKYGEAEEFGQTIITLRSVWRAFSTPR